MKSHSSPRFSDYAIYVSREDFLCQVYPGGYLSIKVEIDIPVNEIPAAGYLQKSFSDSCVKAVGFTSQIFGSANSKICVS